MIKTTLAVLIAATALSAAAPAYAGSSYSVFGDGSDQMREMIADSKLKDLRDKGVNATSIEQWGNLILAFVVDDNGHQTIQLFTPGTLTQVNL